MSGSAHMSRKRSPPQGKIPMYFASPTYKRWVRSELAARGWTLRRFASEVTRAGGSSVTDAALSQFLGREDDDPVGSNTEHTPAINRALGLPPPSIFAPDDELAQLSEAIRARWGQMTDAERAAVEALLGIKLT